MIVMFAGVALCVSSIATEMKFTRISTLGAKSLLRLRHKKTVASYVSTRDKYDPCSLLAAGHTSGDAKCV